MGMSHIPGTNSSLLALVTTVLFHAVGVNLGHRLFHLPRVTSAERKIQSAEI